MSQKNLLHNIYLFKDLNEKELAIINSVAELHTYMPGEEIFSQGDKAMAMYVISFGSVRIHRKASDGDKIEVAILGTGSHFGEMSFLDDEMRSASVVAIEKTDVVTLPYEKMQKTIVSNPEIAVKFYKALSKFLCGRLRLTTTDLGYAREKNISHF